MPERKIGITGWMDMTQNDLDKMKAELKTLLRKRLEEGISTDTDLRSEIELAGILRCTECAELIVKYVGITDLRTSQTALEAIERIGDNSVISTLIDIMETSDDEDVIGPLILSIGAIGGVSDVDRLVPYLDHPSDYIRCETMHTLSKVGWKGVIPVLKERLFAEDIDIAVSSLEGLARLGVPLGYEDLKTFFENCICHDIDISYRYILHDTIAKALRRLDNPETHRFLIYVFDHIEEYDVYQPYLSVLGRMQNEYVVSEVVRRLEDPSPSIRQHTLRRVCGFKTDPRIIKATYRCLSHSDKGVSSMALSSLTTIFRDRQVKKCNSHSLGGQDDVFTPRRQDVESEEEGDISSYGKTMNSIKQVNRCIGGSRLNGFLEWCVENDVINTLTKEKERETMTDKIVNEIEVDDEITPSVDVGEFVHRCRDAGIDLSKEELAEEEKKVMSDILNAMLKEAFGDES